MLCWIHEYASRNENKRGKLSSFQFKPKPGAYLGFAFLTTPLLTLCLLVKENKRCQVTEIWQTLLMVAVAYGQERIHPEG